MTAVTQPPLEAWSIGHIASQLRMPVTHVAGCLTVLGHKPSIIINGVPHFDTDAYLEMLDRAEKGDKAAAAQQREVRLHG